MADGSIAVDEAGPTDRTSFVGMLVGFGDQLRAAGIPIGSGDLLTFCAAMALLDPGDVLDLYWAGRTSLVGRHDHIPIYDRVFRIYFLDHPDDLQEPARAVLKQSQIENQSVIEVPFAEPAQPGKEEEARLGLMASDIEIWRNKAFSACTDEELAALRRIMNQVKVIPPRRRSRRTAQSRVGSRPDLRRTVRTTMRTHGEPSELFWRQRRLKMRPLVLILDVSGSMAEYSRNLLQFAYSTRRAATRVVEVFCFGTRLTRITRALERRRPDDALDEAARSVFDWEGGTRIGQAIDTFVRQWGRRGMSRGAIVVICSDGLDRGDPALLAAAMERLSRLCHKVVWMNPHKGDDPEFIPTTLGMMVAAPYIDLILSGHDLTSLEELAERLPELR